MQQVHKCSKHPGRYEIREENFSFFTTDATKTFTSKLLKVIAVVSDPDFAQNIATLCVIAFQNVFLNSNR